MPVDQLEKGRNRKQSVFGGKEKEANAFVQIHRTIIAGRFKHSCKYLIIAFFFLVFCLRFGVVSERRCLLKA